MERQWKNFQVIAGIMSGVAIMNITAARSQPASPSITPGSIPSGAVPQGVPVEVEDETVGQVRKYFQGRWRRDPDFPGYLQYHLTLRADGRVKSIVGIGNTSQNYLERTDFLRPGEKLVTVSDREHILQIFLNGNGNVGVSKLKTPPSQG